MKDVSVIVPLLVTNAKQIEMTKDCLAYARAKTSIPFKLVIVESLNRHFGGEQADVYIHERDYGNVSRSLNRALSCCETEFVTLLTNDVFVGDKWLEKMLECFEVKSDCGISTTASTQFNHHQCDIIEPDGVWFSIAMWKNAGKVFDEDILSVWNDTDFIMRTYLSGKRMYRHHGSVADHLIGQTDYIKPDHAARFIKEKKRFAERYGASGHYMFEKLK